MQTIKGEKLLNVLDNYNFESDNSRYVISLGDTAIEDLDDEEVLNDVAQKIVDKNITFIGLGDENSSEQYQQIVQLIPDNARFYEYSDKTAINTIKNNIIRSVRKHQKRCNLLYKAQIKEKRMEKLRCLFL